MAWPQQKRGGSRLHSKQSGGNRTGNKTSFFNPSQAEVVAAVRSLYADQLEPFGRILLRRVRERCAAAQHIGCNADDAPLVDPKYLHRICKSCEGLRVRPVDGNEITVQLLDQPAVFVDVTSPLDPYPPQLWAAAAAYFGSLRGKDVMLPGGRYACAQALASAGLPFLSGRSLGEVCHIVQLAVSHKKILGYIDGNMVPYSHSEESVKEKCAAWQQPFCNPTKQQEPTSWPYATWEETRACLSAILRTSCSPEAGVITVSNVKRLFRSRFGLDLSETALGYSRLSELLQDPRLHDICTVQTRGAGQFIVRRVAMMRGGACYGVGGRGPAATASAAAAAAVHRSSASGWSPAPYPSVWDQGAMAVPRSGVHPHMAATEPPRGPSNWAPLPPGSPMGAAPVCLSTKPVSGYAHPSPPPLASAPMPAPLAASAFDPLPSPATLGFEDIGLDLPPRAHAAVPKVAAIVRAGSRSAPVLPPPGLAPDRALPTVPNGNISNDLASVLQQLLSLDEHDQKATLRALSGASAETASAAGSDGQSPDCSRSNSESTAPGSERTTQCLDSDTSGRSAREASPCTKEDFERMGSRFGDQAIFMSMATDLYPDSYPTVMLNRPMSPMKVQSAEIAAV
mmetsp:Transcript_1310/g.2785  ORF Transcript_1310/g.2785 Transcript_1310/m.2785 type:complete len:625 (-) Transcript_1310:54-1928(-)